MDGSKMATSVRVTMANIQHGKLGGAKGSKESRSRKVHVLIGLVALVVVAGLGTLIAKKGFPDIDPVKVGREINVHVHARVESDAR